MSEPLISICIPAYKKPEFVLRAIQSVLKQSYKNVEIIISDDSPNEDIKIAIQSYISELNIKYYHNQPALKSPRNWNNAIQLSTGDYYMLLHQDDWLESEHCLAIYLAAFKSNPKVSFVFCKKQVKTVASMGMPAMERDLSFCKPEMAIKSCIFNSV